MRILKNELRKVCFQNSFWLILLMFLCINGVFLYSHRMDNVIGAETYQQVYHFMERMPEEEKATYVNERYKIAVQKCHDVFSSVPTYVNERYKILDDRVNPKKEKNEVKGPAEKVKLQFSRDVFIEWQLFHELNNRLQEISTYPEYLLSIQDKAAISDEISIFNQQDTFAIRNEQKTAKDFQKVKTRQLYFANSHSFLEATEFRVTDILIISLLLYVVVLLIAQEKENGLLALVKPLAKGRVPLLITKMEVFFLVACVATFLFLGENYVISGCKYGFNDLDIPLQSIKGFLGSLLTVTIGEYMLLFFISKVLTYFFICLLFAGFILWANNTVTSYIYMVLFFGSSFIVYQTVEGNSRFQLLKYTNVYHWISTNNIYRHYFNLNILTYPVNMISVFIVGLFFLIALLIGGILFIFCKSDCAVKSGNRFFSERKLNPSFCRGLYYQEIYKLMIMQRGLLILILFIGIQVYFYTNNQPYIDSNERYYKQYMTQLEGAVTKEKIEFVMKEKARFESYDKMLSEALKQYQEKEISEAEFNAVERLVNENIKGKEALERVLERINYLTEYVKKTGKKPYFIYETGYDRLTGNSENAYKDDMICVLYMMVTSIAMFSGFFAMEFSSGMIQIISSCRNGYGMTVKKKLMVALVMSVIIFLLSFTPFVMNVMKNYGLKSFTVDAGLIPSLAGTGSGTMLWLYLLFLFAERYVVYLCVLLMVFALSVYFKDSMKTMLVASVLVIGPIVVHILGIRAADFISLNAFLGGNIFLNNLYKGIWPLLLIPLSIGGISCIYLFKHFKALQ